MADDVRLWLRGKPGPKRTAAIARLQFHDYEIQHRYLPARRTLRFTIRRWRLRIADLLEETAWRLRF